MSAKRRKEAREKDFTSRFLSGDYDQDRLESGQRFTNRSKHAQQNRILQTSMLRADEHSAPDMQTLPMGQVVQVYSLYSQVEHEGKTYLCTVRKTLAKLSHTAIVVGDLVRFRTTGACGESGQPDAVIEQVLPRKTILTRADIRDGSSDPIVANAQQMLIVASLFEPHVRWGLVDRMIVAAQSGGLVPIVCLNKIDLAVEVGRTGAARYTAFAREVLAYYSSIAIPTLRTSTVQNVGVEELREVLRNRTTVLAGHSGVGKSSLIRALQPHLELRITQVSRLTGKGKHATTVARRYPLDFGGQVIDTPGVKLFGLWGVTKENLLDYFPDVADDVAPKWREESCGRILQGLREARGF